MTGIEQHLREEEVTRRLRGRSDIEAELRQAEAEHTDLLGRLGLENDEAAEDVLSREEAHADEISQRRAKLEGLIGEEPQDSLPAKRDAAALEVEQKAAALEALGPIAKEPRARERLEVEVRDAEGALDRARDDEANARARVEQNPVDAEEVAALAERLASWQEELAALQRRDRVYSLTLREITAAEQATMQRATRYLERRMAPDVTRSRPAGTVGCAWTTAISASTCSRPSETTGSRSATCHRGRSMSCTSRRGWAWSGS